MRKLLFQSVTKAPLDQHDIGDTIIVEGKSYTILHEDQNGTLKLIHLGEKAHSILYYKGSRRRKWARQ